MSLAHLSVKRPIFISCIVIMILAVGYISMKRLPVDLFPNISFPIVMVNTIYQGAGPEEIETLVSKVLEDEVSNVPGIKSLRSINRDSLSQLVVEFTLSTDIRFAESQIRDRVSAAKRKLPDDIQEPVIRRLDPSDQPILSIAVKADLPEGKLFDLVDQEIRPKFEQVKDVGLVNVIGGRKREIRVELDRSKLNSYELSASGIAARLGATGQNIPAGKISTEDTEKAFRTVGEFKSIQDITSAVVNFVGNDVPVTVAQVGRVVDGLEDEVSRTFLNGERAVFIMVFKQSGTNTVAVARGIRQRLAELEEFYKESPSHPTFKIVRSLDRMVSINVEDVEESIMLGIGLTIIVVLLFLGSFRSTLITGLALPNSLLGAFILMSAAGFSINVMTLLALSLAVGLLVDDAIVVRENIFRHIEEGMPAREASIFGTNEVSLAVVATTMAVIAVFGPVGFLKGVVGQFFKEFGLTICFAMAISLFDAMTIAPMLSAYFAGKRKRKDEQFVLYRYTFGFILDGFEAFQEGLEAVYARLLTFTMRAPALILFLGIVVSFGCLYLGKYVPKTFLSPQEYGEFEVALELPLGTSLDGMQKVATDVDDIVRKNPEVEITEMTVGNREAQSNYATIFVRLISFKKRKVSTVEFKDLLRKQLVSFEFAKIQVRDIDMVAGGMRPFSLNISGQDLTQLQEIAHKLHDKIKDHPALRDVDITHRPGKPEVQVVPNQEKMVMLGMSTSQLGSELRTLVEGTTPAVFREGGHEYNIRVRLKPEQRDLESSFNQTFVPNINQSMVRLSDVADMKKQQGPATIYRQDRARYIQIGADVAPKGPGMQAAMEDIESFFKNDIKLPPDVHYTYVGQAQSFSELKENIVVAFSLAILFIFLVLASLYESFITPFTIMSVLPLAAMGAIVGLFITGKSLDINSMIGCILLMGLASKNSILIVDYANQKLEEGMSRKDAILAAGKTRLRPILMTTVALIAGMLPIAIGLNEASKQRTAMGVAVIGGLITSTLLSLVMVPALFWYVDRFQTWFLGFLRKRILS